MPHDQRQKLLSALKEWFLFEAGITQAVNNTKKEIMIEFSRYQAAVNDTLQGILNACLEEKAAVANLLQAMASQDKEQIDSAIGELSAKQQKIVDAIAGIITTTVSPTAATPVPAAASGTMPPLVIPDVAPAPATTVDPLASGSSASVQTPVADPQVPITVEPSPSGVGVDGGSSISVTPTA